MSAADRTFCRLRARLLTFLGRLASRALTVLAVSVVSFLFIRVLRADAFGPPGGILSQLWEYHRAALLHLDLGESITQNRPVADVIGERYGVDVYVMVGGLAFGLAIGIAAGVFVTRHPRAIRSRLLEVAGVVAICAPVYWVSAMLILLFAPGVGSVAQLDPFAESAYRGLGEDAGGWLSALLVPCLVVGAPLAAMAFRMLRATARESLDEDYVRTANGKGLSERRVLYRHALAPAFPPVLALGGATASILVGNALLVEQIFNLPGAFRYVPRAVRNGDFPLLQALTVMGAIFVVTANLVVDWASARLDPRIRR